MQQHLYIFIFILVLKGFYLLRLCYQMKHSFQFKSKLSVWLFDLLISPETFLEFTREVLRSVAFCLFGFYFRLDFSLHFYAYILLSIWLFYLVLFYVYLLYLFGFFSPFGVVSRCGLSS